MSVSICIVQGPIPSEARAATPADGKAGAILSFEGVVRESEADRSLLALDYEAYEPMASRQLASIAEEVVRTHGLLSLACWHSRGRVRVNQPSLRVVVHARHRAESLAAMAEFIDRLKRDVPIWKRPVWKDQEPR